MTAGAGWGRQQAVNASAPQRFALRHPAPLDWLLDPTDPVARLRALRELHDRAEFDDDVRAAQKAVLELPRVKMALAAQKQDGGFGDLAKEDTARGTAWTLSWLLQLGVSPREPRVVKAAHALLAGRFVREDVHRPELPDGAYSFSREPGDIASCVSGDNLGIALQVLGPIDENRRAVMWLLRTQRHDGGWLHCHRWSWKTKAATRLLGSLRLHWPEESDPAVRSCRFGTFRVMRGLATLPDELRDDLVRKALTRGAEFFLARGVTGSLERPDVDVEPKVRSFSRSFALVGTPVRQTLDMLAVARQLVDLGYGADPRLARTLERLCDAQKPDGRWRCESNSTGMLGGDEQPAGQPSKLVTIDALALLRRVLRSHGQELDLAK